MLASSQSDAPLVQRTELRDVRLIAVRSKNQERPVQNLRVRVDMDKWAYKAEPGMLLVTLRTEAVYFEQSEQVETGSRKGARVGRVIVTHLAELELKDDPSTVSRARMAEFLERNLMFMMYPYVRASLQRYAADVLLPPVVLPYLRRDVPTHAITDGPDPEETNEPQ